MHKNIEGNSVNNQFLGFDLDGEYALTR